MSLQALSWAFQQNQISKTSKLVLLSLANCVNASHNNKSYPSYDYLQVACCGASRATIARALNELEQLNLITRHYRGNLQTGKKSTCYELNFAIRLETELMGDLPKSSVTEKFSDETIEKFSFDTRKVSKLNSNQEIEPVNKDNQEMKEGGGVPNTNKNDKKPKRASAPPAPAQERSQPYFLPEDWQMPLDWLDEAKSKYPNIDIYREAEAFSAYWLDLGDRKEKRSKKTRRGWKQAFLVTWLSRAKPTEGKNGAQRQTRSDITASVNAEINKAIIDSQKYIDELPDFR